MCRNLRRAMFGAGVVAIASSVACEKPAPPAPPTPEVYVAPVEQKDVPVYLELVGQTEGFQDVEIRARVEGFLETVNFQEGTFVKQGDLLYTIDRKPLEAILAQAKADQATADSQVVEGEQRRHPLHTARRQAGGQQAGTRRLARRAGRGPVATGGRARPPWRRPRSISVTRGSRRRSAG